MSKYKCPICGYTYDEAVGLREKGIPPGTLWEDLSPAFVCPQCGAPKAVFERLMEADPVAATAARSIHSDVDSSDTLREMTAGELAAVFANLSKGCEKQGLVKETGLFLQLAEHYQTRAGGESGVGMERLLALVGEDLTIGMPAANASATAAGDRGALRAMVWSEKVSRIGRSLLDRYERDGSPLPSGAKVYVCDICGFIYVGDTLPDVCPVCKVPNFKMSPVARR